MNYINLRNRASLLKYSLFYKNLFEFGRVCIEAHVEGKN